MNFFDPWTTANPYANELELELERELSDGHILLGKSVTIIARRKDNDDVLVRVFEEPEFYAVVHLTWSKNKERVRTYPWTTIYRSWFDWVNGCMLPTHRQWVKTDEVDIRVDE